MIVFERSDYVARSQNKNQVCVIVCDPQVTTHRTVTREATGFDVPCSVRPALSITETPVSGESRLRLQTEVNIIYALISRCSRHIALLSSRLPVDFKWQHWHDFLLTQQPVYCQYHSSTEANTCHNIPA